MEEAMRQKDMELEERVEQMEKIIEDNSQLVRKNVQLDLRVKNLNMMQMKDANMKLREKDDEIEIMREMIVNYQAQIKKKDKDIKNLRKQPNRTPNKMGSLITKQISHYNQNSSDQHLQQP